MLSEEEKRELLEGAASESLRRDFNKMRENRLSQRVDVDGLMRFLTACSRFCGDVPPPRHVSYREPLL